MKKFKAEEVLEIAENLIGNIKPVGETNTDNERFENLKQMCDLTDSLIKSIYEVSYDNRNSMESSVRRASDYAGYFLTETVGIGI